MSLSPQNILVQTITWWEGKVLRHPWKIVLVFLIATGWTLDYTMKNLSVNANTAEMLSLDLPFQRNRIRLESAFPQDVSTFLMVVEGNTPEQTAEAVRQLGEALRARTDNIKSVYLPDDSDFFQKNGLLYLDLPELEELSVDLANAQPFIGRLATDFSLRGLFSIIGDALTHQENDFEFDLDPLLSKLAEATDAAAAGTTYRLSWQQLMLKDQQGPGITQRFINITPVLHFDQLMPAEQSYLAINSAIQQVKQGPLSDIRVRLTGEVMLEYEEMATIGKDMISAGAGSLVLVCITLWVAFGSFQLMIATIASLTMGLIFSLGFAAFAIGQLNMISIAFAVLFIGMGDAYSSHFCLRYRELALRGLSVSQALRRTFVSTGPSLALCTLTAAIGLYAFIPTSYVGVAELGIISGTSMFIALGTTFTVLPALIKIVPSGPLKPGRQIGARIPSLLSHWVMSRARIIRIVTILAVLVALALLTRVEVDFNPINLRDPNSESVQTFKYLLQSRDTSPLTLAALAGSESAAEEAAARFESLPTVDRVVRLSSFIPEQQPEKLAIIEDLALIIGADLAKFPSRPSVAASLAPIDAFLGVVRRQRMQQDDPTLKALDESLTRFATALIGFDADQQAQILEQLQAGILGDLPATMHKLQRGLQAATVTRETLPPDLVERWVSAEGLYRLQIYPEQDLNDLRNLRRFIRQAQTVDPDVTDVPVTYLESMNAVLQAFKEAFGAAFVAITLLLLLIQRSVRDTVLVLLPLLLASLFTAALTVPIKVPFNFANIIVLPLLFGLGVDNGIHMAHRLHYLRNGEANLLSTSESKGVFYGALTTVFSFVSLAFTRHPGTASIGILLAAGLMLSLICSLIVLPAFSTWKFNPFRRTV